MFATFATFAQKSKANSPSAKSGTDVHVTYACPMHPDVVSNNPGTCPKCGSKLVVDRRGSKQPAAVYTCPMHPDVVSSKPGKCPHCGMEMVQAKAKAN